jgi:spermidine/putrescine transport system ATP-binding protein
MTSSTTSGPGRPGSGGSGPGAVQLRGLQKRYGGVVAVDHVDIDVRAGEFLSLLGPSGCGKTTTLRMLAGFEQPDRGEILISGQAVQGVPPHKRNVNTVFQAFALFPHMTVAENVAYGLRQKRVPKARRASASARRSRW